ncbi:MAG: hypothetical protein HY876_09960 [Coriobacteriales bacterium]|nr:hypothetical protein [Coriobacteriales bacterium]
MTDGPTTKPIPDDAVVRRQVILGVVAGIVFVAILVAGSWLIFGRTRESAPRRRDFQPAQVTTATPSVEPTVTEEPTETAEATDTAQPDDADKTPEKTKPKIAFRLGKTIYVANEDGSEAEALSTSSEGFYAISPDWTKVAWVDKGTHQLMIKAVDGGEPFVAGNVADVRPVWFADSSAVLFRRLDTAESLAPQVLRVPADGGTSIVTGTGVLMAAGPEGTLVIGPQATEGVAARRVEIIRNVTRTPFQAPGNVSGIAAGKDSVLVAVHEPTDAVGIWEVSFDGGVVRRILKGLPAGQTGSIANLTLSPSGKVLAFAAIGDDGYSRMFTMPVAGGTPKALSLRRDAYPLGWTSDGKSILFIEGNQVQGESTALLRVHPDGTSRFMIVSGAKL